MASLTLSIGSLTSSRSASNTKAQTVLENFAAHHGITGTNQEKLDGIVDELVNVLTDTSVNQAAESAAAAAAQAERDDPDNKFED